MSLLFETIRVEGGKLLHSRYHNERLNRSRRYFFPGSDQISLEAALRVPAECGTGVFRCRVEYSDTIGTVTFTPYQRRTVRTLRAVSPGHIDYSHKFTDRSGLERLTTGIREDDVLIVRNGLITDSSHANVAFFDGTAWWTPSTPLLPGTARARLMDEGILRSMNIGVGDMKQFSKVVLINAMIGFDPDTAIEMGNVIF